MKNNKYLWEILNLDKNFKCSEVDIAYSKIENKTEEVKRAWKILRDEYYSEVYKKYLDIDTVIKAGFILDNLELEEMDYYNLDFLTTPVSKIIKNIDKRSLWYIILSGIATGASWLCYYKALQDGLASIVVPIDKLSILITVLFAYIFLKEKLSRKSLVGLTLITVGTLILLIKF